MRTARAVSGPVTQIKGGNLANGNPMNKLLASMTIFVALYATAASRGHHIHRERPRYSGRAQLPSDGNQFERPGNGQFRRRRGRHRVRVPLDPPRADGERRRVGSQPGLSNANAINDSSWIVGGSNSEAYLYTPQTGMQGLGFLPGGSLSEAANVNNAGVVVGVSATVGTTYLHPFIWDTTNGMRDLNSMIVDPPTGWTPTCAKLINGSGVIAGIGYPNLATYPPSGAEHAFVLSGGRLTEILSPAGNIQPEAINASGEVVGFYNSSHAFEYTASGGIRDIGSLGGEYTGAFGLNDQGMIVGSSELSDGSDAAFLYTDSGGMVDLNALAPVNGWTFDGAYSINKNGQIVVQGFNANYDCHGFLLTPTQEPEPSTFGLLIILACIILISQLCRRRLLLAPANSGMNKLVATLTIFVALYATAASADTIYNVSDLGTFGGASLQSDVWDQQPGPSRRLGHRPHHWRVCPCLLLAGQRCADPKSWHTRRPDHECQFCHGDQRKWLGGRYVR